MHLVTFPPTFGESDGRGIVSLVAGVSHDLTSGIKAGDVVFNREITRVKNDTKIVS